MDSSRRGFLKAFGIGAVGVLAAVHVPAAAVKFVGLESHAREYARDVLRREFNRYATKHGLNRMPHAMYAGRELVDAYGSELRIHLRYCGTDALHPNALLFKGVPVVENGSGWYAKSIRYMTSDEGDPITFKGHPIPLDEAS